MNISGYIRRADGGELAFEALDAPAFYGIWRHKGQELSAPGLALAVLVIPGMYVLATAKMRGSKQIGSRALRADAVGSITCGYLSSVVVIGLLVQLLMPVWWAEGIASLAIVGFLGKRLARRRANELTISQ